MPPPSKLTATLASATGGWEVLGEGLGEVGSFRGGAGGGEVAAEDRDVGAGRHARAGLECGGVDHAAALDHGEAAHGAGERLLQRGGDAAEHLVALRRAEVDK